MNRWAAIIDLTTQKLFEWVSYLNIVMVISTFVVVVLRYGFDLGWVWLQEISRYAHVMIFLTAAAYALKADAHVRVDIFYQKLSAKNQALMDGLGTLFLLFPTCGVIVFYSYRYVLNSWQVLEGSKDGGGLEAVFILKSFILVYGFLLMAQGLSSVLNKLRVWRSAP